MRMYSGLGIICPSLNLQICKEMGETGIAKQPGSMNTLKPVLKLCMLLVYWACLADYNNALNNICQEAPWMS